MNVMQTAKLIVDGELLSTEAMAERVDAWLAIGGRSDDGDGFAQWLVAEQWLTDFQGEAIRAGLAGPYSLGPYRVHERIALGELGDIFRAVHSEFNQPVGLKIFPTELNADPQRLACLARETRVAVQVDHPNVVRTFQVGRVGEVTFLAIEDLRGESLASLFNREVMLPAHLACDIARQVALGLEHLHSLDIVHRGIHPDNIWVTPDGGVKLMEFSAAHDAMAFLDADEGAQSPRAGMWHYDYTPPALVLDPTTHDPRNDIYSLGCVLYHGLTGMPPFSDRDPVRKMLQHALASPRSLLDHFPELPVELADIVQTMLAKRPQERFQHARHAAMALDNFTTAEQLAQRGNVPLNPDFMAWVRAEESRDLLAPKPIVDAPEISDFIDWLSKQRADAAEPSHRRDTRN